MSTVIPAEEIVTYLDAQVTGLTASTNLFYSRLPDQPNACVAVFSTGGTAPYVSMIGQSQADITVGRPSFQVRVRDPIYAHGYAVACECFAALQSIVNTVIAHDFLLLEGGGRIVLEGGGGFLLEEDPGSTWLDFVALQSQPVDMGRDAKQRHEFSQNFVARWHDPNR